MYIWKNIIHTPLAFYQCCSKRCPPIRIDKDQYALKVGANEMFEKHAFVRRCRYTRQKAHAHLSTLLK